MINLNLRHLEAFLAVAAAGNFTRAAQALHISQPALTVQIRQLEEALGTRLLDRNTRSVKLTRIGQQLTPVVQKLLRELEGVVLNARDLASGQRGLVTIAALPSVCSTLLPSVIAAFRAEHPGITVTLRDAVAQRVLSMVKSEEADFGVGSFSEMDPEIQLAPLFRDRMRVVFPPGSPLEQKRSVRLKDLAGMQLILMDQQSSVRTLVNRAFESDGLFPVPAYEVTYMSTALGLVKAGLGVAFLPSTAPELLETRGIRSKTLQHPALSRNISAAMKSGRPLPPAATGLLHALIAYAKKSSHSGK